MDADKELAAAPPDAGGHLGTTTRPDQVLQADHDASVAPSLHRMDAPRLAAHRPRRRPGLLWAFVVAAVVVGLLGVAAIVAPTY